LKDLTTPPLQHIGATASLSFWHRLPPFFPPLRCFSISFQNRDFADSFQCDDVVRREFFGFTFSDERPSVFSFLPLLVLRAAPFFLYCVLITEREVMFSLCSPSFKEDVLFPSLPLERGLFRDVWAEAIFSREGES